MRKSQKNRFERKTINKRTSDSIIEENMQYVIYIAPPPEIEEAMYEYKELISSKIVSVPKKPSHCTLMNPHLINDEKSILDALASVHAQKFHITCNHIEKFDDNFTVIRLEKVPMLMQLHEQIIYAMQPFIDWKSTAPIPAKYENDSLRCAVYKKAGSPHFLACYNPHITIAMTNSEYVQVPDFFKDKGFDVKEFIVVRKESDRTWTKIATFSLD